MLQEIGTLAFGTCGAKATDVIPGGIIEMFRRTFAIEMFSLRENCFAPPEAVRLATVKLWACLRQPFAFSERVPRKRASRFFTNFANDVITTLRAYRLFSQGTTITKQIGVRRDIVARLSLIHCPECLRVIDPF